jgi:SAM-dependent methyltransferase
MAEYDNIREAYDLVFAKQTAEKVPFVIDILEKHQKKNILELGSGSGLFTIPLSQAAFNIEGLELSREMIELTHKSASHLNIHQGNIRQYALGKQFDAILGLSSVLVLLQNHQEMNQCLQCTYEHLQPEGILLLELPNHPVEIRQSHHTQEVHHNDDYSIIIVIQSLKEEKYWREYWSIFRKTPEKFQHEESICDEFLYSPNILEEDLNKVGFEIIEKYGDLLGHSFEAESSWRQVLICKKT